MKLQKFITTLILFIATALTSVAQGTTFTYQGRLSSGASGANGSYDLRFVIYDAPTFGTQQGAMLTNSATAVSNGLFTVTLDFGNQFPGANRWLEIGVRTNGNGAFTTLAPRQALTPTPYAMFAATAGSAGSVSATNIAGTLTDALLSTNVALRAGGNTFTGNQTVAGGSLEMRGSGPDDAALITIGNSDFSHLLVMFPGRLNDPNPFILWKDGDPLRFATDKSGFTEMMRIASNGNVGIGTATPSQKLQIVGPENSAIDLATGPVTLRSSVNSVAGAAVGTVSSHDFTLFTGNLPRQTITANGKVGLNKINPATALDVNGTVTATAFSGDGANLTNVTATTLNGLTSTGFWRTNGNAGSNPTNGAFIGTTDNLPLDFKVNGQQVLRLQPNGASDPNIIGGFSGNIISNGVVGGVIAGGGNSTFPNHLGGNYATVVGGVNNTAGGAYSTAMGGGSIAGGAYSTAMGGGSIAIGPYCTAMGGGSIASGYASTAMGSSTFAVGAQSTAMGASTTASGNQSTAMGEGTTAGYEASTAMGSSTLASGFASTAMGEYSTASGSASTAMGESTTASGNYSVAAGFYSQANNQGDFVWADSTSTTPFASTANDQFLVRASGGVGINTNNPNGAALAVNGVVKAVSSSTEAFEVGGAAAGYALLDRATGAAGRWSIYASGGTLGFFGAGSTRMSLTSAGAVTALSFNPTSDRNAKENFAPVQPREVLEKVVALPLSSWNYKADTTTRHVGPMAQDFYAAFNVGPDDKHIATVDADGVALAAIQGLNQKLNERDAKIEDLEKKLDALQAMVNQLAEKK